MPLDRVCRVGVANCQAAGGCTGRLGGVPSSTVRSVASVSVAHATSSSSRTDEVPDDGPGFRPQPPGRGGTDVVGPDLADPVEERVDELAVTVEQHVLADQVGPLLLPRERRQPRALGLGHRGLHLDLGGTFLHEPLQLLDHGGLDGLRVLAVGHVDDEEAQRDTVDEPHRVGLDGVGDLLAPHQSLHQS